MSAMPVAIGVLCLFAIAYRYYSAFLAARVLALSETAETPAVKFNDGSNFHPTNKWVLFGHHFAAISGAGPLIGPVLAAQFGYMPGLLWIVIGVCLAGAVQDFLVLAMSTRRGGRSLAQLAYSEVGKTAGIMGTVAILFILVIAIAGLGKVVVKALGGEEVKYPAGAVLKMPEGAAVRADAGAAGNYLVPPGSTLAWSGGEMVVREGWTLHTAQGIGAADAREIALPKDAVRLVPGSSWGTFTIAATIPIALLVGAWMYRIRKGRVVEASLIGAVLTLLATVAGGYVAQSSLAHWFELSATQITWAMAIYGFVASVLPVWVLLCPRDYLSSFLKIGTIGALVIGVIVANPKLHAPAVNDVFLKGGPIVPGTIFPFLFITVMCGAISGFHALVSSGTTPKMVARETDTRMIGYGAMMIEGLVAVVAMLAAASLPTMDYYAMNTELAQAPAYHDRILMVGGAGGIDHVGDNIAQYEALTNEQLRGRTGGAVTLAVGMAHIFDGFFKKFTDGAWLSAAWKYWYHFAIMFEALFILTTIDTGTRVGRFLMQEVLGKVHPKLGLQGGWMAGILATGIMVLGWVYFLTSGPFATIWAMFGIANQMLAVIALAVVTAYLFNTGRGRWGWVTVVPMGVVFTTTSSAAVVKLSGLTTTVKTQVGNTGWTLTNATLFNATLQAALIVGMLACTIVVILSMVKRAMFGQREATPQGLEAHATRGG